MLALLQAAFGALLAAFRPRASLVKENLALRRSMVTLASRAPSSRPSPVGSLRFRGSADSSTGTPDRRHDRGSRTRSSPAQEVTGDVDVVGLCAERRGIAVRADGDGNDMARKLLREVLRSKRRAMPFTNFGLFAKWLWC
jgi:hypothetical protein